MIAQLKSAVQKALQSRGYEVRRDAHGKRVFGPMPNRRGSIQKHVFGFQMSLDLSEDIQFAIAHNDFEPIETTWLEDYLKSGMTFVDVGANVGFFSLLASRAVGQNGRVFAFEPSARAANHLRQTIAYNAIENITLTEAACGEVAGEMPLRLWEESCHSPSLVQSTNGQISLGNVPVARLDESLRALGVERINLIKIDVEGFEPEVLRGLDSYFQDGAVDAVLCELNETWLDLKGETMGQLDSLIRDFGFEISISQIYPDHRNIFYVKACPISS